MAQSLVRAALELGNSNEPLYGVDPLREQTNRGKWTVVFLAIVFKTKVHTNHNRHPAARIPQATTAVHPAVLQVALTGFLIKVAMKRYGARLGAKSTLP